LHIGILRFEIPLTFVTCGTLTSREEASAAAGAFAAAIDGAVMAVQHHYKYAFVGFARFL
jgi:hypothetical protein